MSSRCNSRQMDDFQCTHRQSQRLTPTAISPTSSCITLRLGLEHHQSLSHLLLANSHTFGIRQLAWLPNVLNENLKKLALLQNKGLRLVTGQLQSTPQEALNLEADVPTFKMHSQRLIARSYEKALCSLNDHPKRLALEEDLQNLKKRTNWRKTALEIAETLPPELNNRKLFDLLAVAPWTSCEDRLYAVMSTVPRITSRHNPA